MNILDYKIILIPLIVVFAVQIIKIIIDLIKKEFRWDVLLNYGGMPSGHTALVVSTATVIGLIEGVFSPLFLLAIVLAILVIRDALGFRIQLSAHAKIINRLIKELPDDKEFAYPYSPERIGHTFTQVVVGAIIGLFATIFLFLWW